jgi:hypothetical protein
MGPPLLAKQLRAALRHGFVDLALAARVVGLIGLLRLGRQFPAAAASPALLTPFLLPVLALALEAAALVAGCSAQLRALLTTPQTSFVSRLRATLPQLALAAAVIALAQLIPRGTEHPGRFANELVQSARESCESSSPSSASSSVPVPLLGLSVSCGSERLLSGEMPGVRAARIKMRELSFSDDLRRVDIVGLELFAERALKVHLHADRARVAGLAPWSRSPRLSSLLRAGVLLGLVLLVWLAACLAFRPRSAEPALAAGPRLLLRRIALAVLLATPGAAAATGFVWLDQERAAPVAYLGAALAGLAVLSGVVLLARRVPQMFSPFARF